MRVSRMKAAARIRDLELDLAEARARLADIAANAVLTDAQIDAIIAGVHRQVDHNGWEEPYVRNRFRQELAATLAAPTQEAE